MKSLLKIEMSRAFRNPLFLMTLVLGCGVALAHLSLFVLPAARENAVDWPLFYRKLPPNSVFNRALGMEFVSMYQLIYVYIFPILSALPYADSLYTDIKSGYIKNVFIRTKKGHYFAAKYIAVFLTAGTAVVIPLLLSLFASAALLPSIVPEPYTSSFAMSPATFMGHLFFSNPYGYTFLWYIVTFVTAGFLAALALAFSHFLRNRFLVLLTPFILYMTIELISMQTGLYDYNIRYWVMPVRSAQLCGFTPVLITMLVIGFPALAVYVKKGRCYETY